MKKILSLSLMLCMTLTNALWAKVNIIPLPTQVKETGSSFVLKDGQTIGYSDASLRDAANYLQQSLTCATGFKIPVRQGKGTITLTLCKKGKMEGDSYTLSVTNEGVQAQATTYKGITNAIASIRQLLPAEIETPHPVNNVEWIMPTVEIQDTPNYAWRGLMLDPVRHFYSVEETKRLINLMALYKYSKFHWHLTDGQGWRIEIKAYPELAKQGGFREHDGCIDTPLLERAKNENDVTLEIPSRYYKEINGEKKYGGYYTQEQIRDVVRYAAQRGLDVVPEIDMPGHNEMAHRIYPWLSCTGHITGVYCLGQERTMEFCRRVYKEVFQLFPYEYVHIGGDEVNRSVWEKCDKCQKRIKDNNLKGVEELQAWFTREMEKYFNANGKKLLGWEEILDGGVTKTATIYWWRGDHPDITQRSTAMGNEVVVCPFSFCYFDYGQDDNTLRNIYDGDIVPTDLDDNQKKLIRGIQANIWCEWIPTEARMQYMVFPRALAMAEKAWTPRNSQQWDDFLPRLREQLKRLDRMGVNYRPLPKE